MKTYVLNGDSHLCFDDEEKTILGFCNNTPLDENDRVNIQGGFELLPK